MMKLNIHNVAHIQIDHYHHYKENGGLNFVSSTYYYYDKSDTCIGTLTVYSSDYIPVKESHTFFHGDKMNGRGGIQ